MLPFVVIGLTTGAVYALAGLGLVLTYKTSGVFNFAMGALATVAAYVFYVLNQLHHWSWVSAALVAVFVGGPLMGLILELLARRIQTTTLALQVACTVGLLLVIEAGVTLIYGTETTRTVPIFLGTDSFELFGTSVQVAQVVTFVFAVVVTVALTLFFKYSRRGLAMRAVVDNPALLDVAGVSPTATRRTAWVIGAVLMSCAGVLFAPLLSLDPVLLTLLVVSAFGAAAIGAFTSLPLTLAGGLFIGVLAALCTKWFTTGILTGLAPSLPFVVLFGVLLLFPKKYLTAKTYTVPRSRPSWRAPAQLQLPAALAVVVLLILAPSFAGIHLTAWTTFVAMTIVFMSLSLLTRTSGQVSLCHVSFTAIGACAFSQLAVENGVPWFLALALAGVVCVPIGALLAIPAVRLSGLYLALATFGFGILLQGMFYTQDFMFGADGSGKPMPRPDIASSDESYYYLVLVVAIIAAVFVVVLNRTRLGRLLRGQADSSIALETSGNSVRVTRVLVFGISAFLAAIGGALAGVGQTTIAADSYAPLLSLTYFALIIIVVGREPWDAILAAAALFLVPSYVSGEDVDTVLQLAFGAVAMLVAILPAGAQGVPVGLQRFVDQRFGSIKLPLPTRRPKPASQPAPVPIIGDGLHAHGLEVRFGGLVAVDGVTIDAPRGSVTGLIGPNGAGKTTTFNACTGLVRPAKGAIRIGAADVSRRSPAFRAQHGLGRTFQKIELFDTLTVRENVEAGAEAAMAGSNPWLQFASKRGQRAQIVASAETAMAMCDLTDLADTPAASLSTGQRRLVELARCIAGPFGLLLLDEPSSGLDRVETQRFAAILKTVVASRGVGILLVEHDMSLVLDLCENIYVLDFGKLIFEGAPADVAASPVVRAAYLGDAAVDEAVEHAEHEIERIA